MMVNFCYSPALSHCLEDRYWNRFLSEENTGWFLVQLAVVPAWGKRFLQFNVATVQLWQLGGPWALQGNWFEPR